MSDNIILLTTASLTPNDFAAFLTDLGGDLDPGETTRGGLSDGERNIWLFFSPETVEEVLEEGGEALVDVLGQAPRSAFVAELGREPSGRPLAYQAAAEFCRRWPPAVMDDGEILFVPSAAKDGTFEAVRAGDRVGVDERPAAVAE